MIKSDKITSDPNQDQITKSTIHFYNDIQVEDRNKFLSGDTGIVDHHFGLGKINLSSLNNLSDSEIAVIIRQLEENQAEMLINLINPSPKDLILDAGCGRGGTALRLVQGKGCRVEGITLAKYQADFATKSAHKLGLSKKAHFSVMNMLNLSYPDNMFDKIITNETTMYIVDLKKLFLEFRRVLKPNGRYILATWNINEEYGTNNPYVQPINKHYGVMMHTNREYIETLKTSGFNILKDIDLTNQVIPHWEIRSKWTQASGVERYYLEGHKKRAILYKMISVSC